MRCGLLGRKLGHSYSPQIHAQLGSYPYALFEKEPEELADFLRSGEFTGINVTVPYKKAVLPYLDQLSPQARALGAVNTIIRRDGKLIGHNTDYFGFQHMLQESGLAVSGKKVLVLGSGGASNTAVAVLQAQNAQVVVISRNGENHYGNLHLHADARIIVNTTPVGMYPETDACPIDLSLFPHLEGVLDLIYNPARTRLLQAAEERGLVAVNGLSMLVAQAVEASAWFTGQALDTQRIAPIHRDLVRQMENIILIGMPGSGKTNAGCTLAEKMGRKFTDLDAKITIFAQKTPRNLLLEEGEDAFRAVETQVLSVVSRESGLVIATGGGCVTRPENYAHLHQNGRIFWLNRELSSLPTEGRPLSQAGSLEEMYRIRKPLYDKFSDYSIDNNGTIADTVQQIMTIWEEIP